MHFAMFCKYRCRLISDKIPKSMKVHCPMNPEKAPARPNFRHDLDNELALRLFCLGHAYHKPYLRYSRWNVKNLPLSRVQGLTDRRHEWARSLVYVLVFSMFSSSNTTRIRLSVAKFDRHRRSINYRCRCPCCPPCPRSLAWPQGHR